MMIKILLLIPLLISLVCCSNVSNNNNQSENYIMEDIHIAETDWCNIEWNQIQH